MSGRLAGIGLFLLVSCSSGPLAAAEPLRYRLTYPGSSPDRVSVSLEVDAATPGAVFLMPRAIPMGYSEQPYARFVSNLRAFGPTGETLDVERGQGPRWLIGSSESSPLAKLTYEVDLRAMEREILDSSAASKARDDYVGILGYSVFGYLEGLEDRPIRLVLESPKGWPCFTTLEPSSDLEASTVVSEADNFYALADSQVLMGPALEVHRVGTEPPLFVAGYAEAPWDIELTGRLGGQALDALVAYFGSAPFDHFTMVSEILKPLSAEHEYGFSMEHLDSATFFLGPERALTEASTPRDRRKNLYNYAHHIAHAWIPKRCAGRGYFPFDWEFAPVLDSIWFSEGFGQYAAGVALAEQMEEENDFLELLLEERFRRSLADAPESIRRMTTIDLSRVASTRYGSDFRLGRSIFSRGALMAAEMDETIREATRGAKSLKDGLRHLLGTACETESTVPEDELPRLLLEATGVDVEAVYGRWMGAQTRTQ